MSDVMVPIPFKQLLAWVLQEYASEKTVFGIPEEKFYTKKDSSAMRVFGELCETPLGPAAGPHTQVAQNIAAAYLAGGRFFELKTVQIMDELEIEKPCIDAELETYNTEWSTELTVQQAYDEYVKAWFLLHALNAMFGLSKIDERAFVFNMSVGYDLEGIKSPKIDGFIEGLKDASDAPIFQECRAALKQAIQDGVVPAISDPAFADAISPAISHSVTLSTMHGTPPEDQERICKYLMAEKGLHTYVKLNPTLHGYQYVKNAFAELGYDHIQLKEESFTHDMQYPAAVEMLHNLTAHAAECGVEFGVKLSNTLAVVNDKGTLPTDEMYMSGRALYPLTVNLALKLSREFNGKLTISYSGGADAFNYSDLLKAGLKPITMATYLLKPGGYSRLTQLAEISEGLEEYFTQETVDLNFLERIAAEALTSPRYAKEGKSYRPMKIDRSLELLDCFVAPCTVGCPIHQDIPEYIRLVGEERYVEAFELITAKNPLPFTTGTICEHTCQLKCFRNDYDDPVLIRDLKLAASERGFESLVDIVPPFKKTQDPKNAEIGAVSSGLYAGYFLAREGFEVTVFDKNERPGGMVLYGIPGFRISEEAVANDLALIKRAGVKFELGCDPELDVDQLMKDGYDYVILAIGAWKSRPLKLDGDQDKVHSAIHFLLEFKKDPDSQHLGKNVAVIGGGNSAMDSARAAVRAPGVESVKILYRRTVDQMPAEREELDLALADGIEFVELVSPLSLKGGMLTCQKMTLGEMDASGRRRPVPVEGELVKYPIDSVLTAIGELVNYDLLEANGIEVDEKGRIQTNAYHETSRDNVYLVGDAYRGPASVVEAIADARKAVDGILEKEGVDQRLLTIPEIGFDARARKEAVVSKKALINPQLQKAEFDQSYLAETARCLECNFICDKCVEVCPNRANIAVEVDSPYVDDMYQILHLDALCNECGNCATFCPYQGSPYLDKFTLFWDEEAFLDSDNEGYLPLPDGSIQMRYRGGVHQLHFNDGRVEPEDDSLASDTNLQALFSMMITVRDRYPYLQSAELLEI
ncbi:MAG: putative selenate reductase subunit YgfK [Anaerolineales bacterium]